MLAAIKHGLSNLTNFTGRDSRQTFWLYVLFLVILRFIAGFAASVPLTVRMIGLGVHAAEQGVDREALQSTMQAQSMAMISEMLPLMAWIGVAIGIATMALLVASLVRRLHDSDRSGWWVLLPGGLYAMTLLRAPLMVSQAQEMLGRLDGDMRPNPAALMQGQGVWVFLPWLAIIAVIIFGVLQSSDGPNRFGDTPA